MRGCFPEHFRLNLFKKDRPSLFTSFFYMFLRSYHTPDSVTLSHEWPCIEWKKKVKWLFTFLIWCNRGGVSAELESPGPDLFRCSAALCPDTGTWRHKSHDSRTGQKKCDRYYTLIPDWWQCALVLSRVYRYSKSRKKNTASLIYNVMFKC